MLLSGAPFSSVSLSAVYPNQVYTIETDVAWIGARRQVIKRIENNSQYSYPLFPQVLISWDQDTYRKEKKRQASQFVYAYEPDYLPEYIPAESVFRKQAKPTKKDVVNSSGLTLEPTYTINQTSDLKRVNESRRRFADDPKPADLVPFEFVNTSVVGKSANKRINHQINQIGYVEAFIFVTPDNITKPIQSKVNRFDLNSFIDTVETPVVFEYASDVFAYRSAWKNRYDTEVYQQPIYPVIPGLKPDDRPVSGSPDDNLNLTGIDLGNADGTGSSLYSETATGLPGYSQSYSGLGGYSIAISGIQSGQSLVGYGGAMISIGGNSGTSQGGTGATLGSGIDGTETIDRDATGVDLGTEDGSGRPPN